METRQNFFPLSVSVFVMTSKNIMFVMTCRLAGRKVDRQGDYEVDRRLADLQADMQGDK